MNKKLDVIIYTPFGKYFAGECDYLSFTSGSGVIGVLPNHAPIITTVEISKLILRLNGKENVYATSGGVMRINDEHQVILLLDSIEKSEEIDVSRALKSKERAEARLANNSDEIDTARAKASLLRALNRLDISDNN